MKFPNVPSTSVKLMLFPFSLEGAARIWLDKEPPQSILTWDDLVSKFINKFFPPSKTTNLRNEITRFQQRFDESFYEAWDRFNDLLRACPHHGFSELHQLDTFYNALNTNDQDSLNSAAGGNFLDKMPRECLKIIESKSKVRNSRSKPVVAKVSASTSTSGISPDVSELKDMVKALLLDKQNQSQAPAHQTPASVKAIEESCVTVRELIHIKVVPPPMTMFIMTILKLTFLKPLWLISIKEIPVPDLQCQGPIYQPQVNQPPAYQAPVYQAPAPQTQGVSKTDFDSYVKANDAVMRNMQNQNQVLQNQGQNLQTQLNNLATSNQRLESMLGNFIKMNTASTSGSGTLPGNTITNPKEDLKGITTRSGVAYQGPTIPSTSSSPLKVMNRDTEVTKDTMLPTNNGNTEDVQPPVIEVQPQNPTSEPVVDPVSAPRPNQQTSIPFPSRRIDERRREKANDQIEKFYEVFRDLSFEISFMDALTLMPKFADTKNLNRKQRELTVIPPTPPLPNHKDYSPGIREELKVVEAKTVKSSIDEPPEVELKDLPPHLEYAFLEGDDKLPVIIAKDLKDEEKAALIKSSEILSSTCLSHLEKMLKWCEDTNLSLNWEKSHFMVKKGIVLGHKISKSGIEVDRAKVEVIAKLPHPTTVKGVRSFLGHAGFY
ncbi:reverse transcriptase domain-containing protein [Tanacetum coccineum]|uniref:Reverse transcriptase domain-containing protein n=1 Tax=Tanacetum coccineum TaxID=301880 RepID=A0ABQ5IZP8_9ASTR